MRSSPFPLPSPRAWRATLPLCLLGLVTLTALPACKPRAAVSDVSQGAPSGMLMDASVSDQMYQDGVKYGKDLRWVDNFLQKSNMFSDNDRRFIADTMRREMSYVRMVYNTLKSFEAGDVAIRDQDQRVIALDASRTTRENLVRIFQLTEPLVQAGTQSNWSLQSIFNMKPALAQILPLHAKITDEIGSWRGAPSPKSERRPKATIDDGKAKDAKAKPAADAKGNDSAVADVPDNAGHASGAYCPQRPRQGAPYGERQQYWAEMRDIMGRLVDDKTARGLGLMSRDEFNQVAQKAYKGKHFLPQPGLCGPGTDTSMCFGVPIIEALSQVPELRCLFEADSGVGEGYTLGEHTRMMMEVYITQRDIHRTFEFRFRNQSMDYLFPIILALHDIGKPVAVAFGDRNRQHEFTVPIVQGVMSAMGYPKDEIALALAMIDQDILGDLVIGVDRRQVSPDQALRVAFDSLSDYASKVGMPFKDFARSQAIYYVSDAASYPNVQQTAFVQGGRAPHCTTPGRLCTRSGILENLMGHVMNSNPPPKADEKPAPAEKKPTATPGKADDKKGDDAGTFSLAGGNAARTGDLDQSVRSGQDLGGLMLDVGNVQEGPYRAHRPGADAL